MESERNQGQVHEERLECSTWSLAYASTCRGLFNLHVKLFEGHVTIRHLEGTSNIALVANLAKVYLIWHPHACIEVFCYFAMKLIWS